jgi:hypothetical protein
VVKKLSYLFFFILCVSYSFAQSFQNEWIDYHKTYYKFKIGPFGYDAVGAPIEKGVVRINEASLAAVGLANIPAEQFQLWKDGNEVSIFVSKSSGLLSSSDYIEFWGEIANGTADKQLYSDTSFQLSDHWNLESDSAAYFLTVNPAGNNKRLQPVDNIIKTQLAPEKNFIYTVGRYYRNELSHGFGLVNQNMYLSTYDNGEGFTSRPVRNNNNALGQGQIIQVFSNLYHDPGNSYITARVSMIGDAFYDRSVRILLNSDTIAQFPMGYFLASKQAISNISSHIAGNDTATFIVQNLCGANDDRIRIATI